MKPKLFKIFLFLITINYSLSLLVFPFQIRETYEKEFENPSNIEKTLSGATITLYEAKPRVLVN